MPTWLTDLIGQTATVAVSPAGLLAMATVTVAGFLRGFVGFGSSLIIVMVMSIAVGPAAAVGIAGLSGVIVVLQLLPNAIRYSERAFVVPFSFTTFLAAPIGTAVLVAADPAMMRIIISLFVLAMVVMLYREWQPRSAESPGFLMFAGFAAGVVQGGSGAGGPPAVAIALSRKGSAQTQRANVIGTTSALTLCGLPPLWYSGVLTREVVLLSLVALPSYFVGAWLGAGVFSRHGSRYFRNVALFSLAVIGVLTLLLAAKDYFGWSVVP